MCIAIYKPAGVTISKKTLQQSFRNNPDGAGFALAYKGRLTVRKGYFTFREFWADYNANANKTNGAAIIHFRIATHGAVDADNCHPFSVTKELAFIHNGIINIDIVDPNKSDTSHFNDYFVKPLVADFGTAVVQSAAVQNLLGASIGDSKLIFLDRRGNFAIVNEDLGYWDGGCWYSNKSYCRAKYYSADYNSFGYWNGNSYVRTESADVRDDNYSQRVERRLDKNGGVLGTGETPPAPPFETRVLDGAGARDYSDCMLPGDTGGYREGDAADARDEVDALVGEYVDEMRSDDTEMRADYADGDRALAYGQKKSQNRQKFCANCETYTIVRGGGICMVCGMDANGGIADFGAMAQGLRGVPCQRCKMGVAPTWDVYCAECRHVIDTMNAHYQEQQERSRMSAGLSERADINRRALGIASDAGLCGVCEQPRYLHEDKKFCSTNAIITLYQGNCNKCGEMVSSTRPGTVTCPFSTRNCKGMVKLRGKRADEQGTTDLSREYSFGDSDDTHVIAAGGDLDAIEVTSINN